jgi:hypothetical protein
MGAAQAAAEKLQHLRLLGAHLALQFASEPSEETAGLVQVRTRLGARLSAASDSPRLRRTCCACARRLCARPSR